MNFLKTHKGNKVWKTSEPELDKQLRQSYEGEDPQFTRHINIEVHGEIGEKLIAIARDEFGTLVKVESEILLVEAHTKPMTTEKLQ